VGCEGGILRKTVADVTIDDRRAAQNDCCDDRMPLLQATSQVAPENLRGGAFRFFFRENEFCGQAQVRWQELALQTKAELPIAAWAWIICS